MVSASLARRLMLLWIFLKGSPKCWQILPISPTSYGDSPYQSFSVHAGNPYFIDLEALEKEGYLKPAEYKDIEWGDDKGSVDYGKIYEVIFKVLRTAHKRFRKKPEKAYSKIRGGKQRLDIRLRFVLCH